MTGRTGRAAVYNRYWTTGGGAEKYGGAVAEHLSRRGPVELLTHEPFDRDALAERLSLDLSGCTVREVPHASAAVTEASRGLDLLVNVSHRSRDASAAARSLYVVHFPTAFGSAEPARAEGAVVEWGTGFHQPDGRVTWTDGRATLHVTTDPGRPVDLTLLLGFQRPPAAGPAPVRVLVDGSEAAATVLARPRHPLERVTGRALRVRVVSPAEGVSAEVVLESGAFVPADVVGGDDRRTLGVPLAAVAVGRPPLALLPARALAPSTSMRWLDSYDAVVSNSAFTREWVRARWGADSEVLHPPVTLRVPARKDRVVLSVGRFFPTGQGHSKKQLEMVAAFRSLVDGGLRDWELHLVGGCSDGGRDYLAAVERAAAGYPVVLHVNASGAELEALTARASLYWHLAGLGEDPQRDPDRLEHFGISTVEAMSAGAVPLVVALGGLVETVRDGVDGFHVRDTDELAERTAQLVADPARLAALSSSAVARAKHFSTEAFGRRLDEVLAALR